MKNRITEKLEYRKGECLITGDQSFAGILREIKQNYAHSNLPVLIEGETGTGKEGVARALHSHGNRSDKRFIAINCGAITENSAASELFGHERGAFTGAVSRRLGLFERADGGTIFLDEIGELSLNLQALLLRALQEKEFTRLGGNQSLKVDVRVVAATNRKLLDRVEKKLFRADLYYRLAAITLKIPPLRDRKHDIEILSNHFISEANLVFHSDISGMNFDCLNLLNDYDWPGNVRQLQNSIFAAIGSVRNATEVLKPLQFSFIPQSKYSDRIRPYRTEELKTAILKFVSKNKQCTISDLINKFNRNRLSIRRQLIALEKAGLIRIIRQRGRGGWKVEKK
jgi:transcriptional regulator with PAS, ATPase and Fis domain